MKKLLLLGLLSTIYACTHEIEVYGGGEVLSASGDRHCQQNMNFGPCEVKVFGDYVETYSAIPESDYFRFDRWENCPTAQDNVCEVNIPNAYIQPLWGKNLGFALEAHFVRAPVPEDKLIYFQRNAKTCWTDLYNQEPCRRDTWPTGQEILEIDFRAFLDGTGQISIPTHSSQYTRVLSRRSWDTGYEALTQDEAGRYYFHWENDAWVLVAMMEGYTATYSGDATY